jgi:hypothetical protein
MPLAIQIAFPLGARVRLNDEWSERNFPRLHGKLARVVGHSRDERLVRLKFDHLKTRVNYHRDLVVLLPDPPLKETPK